MINPLWILPMIVIGAVLSVITVAAHEGIFSRRVLVMLVISMGFIIVASGCGTAPYARAGLYAKLPVDTRQDLYNEGSNPAAVFEVGVEWKHAYCSYMHVSHLRDGAPFNNNPEWQLGMAGCGVQFGGH